MSPRMTSRTGGLPATGGHQAAVVPDLPTRGPRSRTAVVTGYGMPRDRRRRVGMPSDTAARLAWAAITVAALLAVAGLSL